MIKSFTKYKIGLVLVFLVFQVYSVCQVNKFQPPAGNILLVIGQDLGAIGGFASPNNMGYVDNFEKIPAGFTSYTSINNLEGLDVLTNYGSGDVCAKYIIDKKEFENTILCLGLYMVGIEAEIANGDYDNNIIKLVTWIKETKVPVFLRIGYEFNGSWNGYDPANYIKAYRKIVDIFNLNQVTNVAFVWQSDGSGTKSDLLKWYPGDGYVDWLAYSHFHNFGGGIIEIAREKNKPVMIAEATPQGYKLSEIDGATVWTNWFAPLFSHIETNKDVIQALCYINVNWDIQPMWAGQNWGDSRIQVNEFVKQKWIEETTKEQWLQQSDSLYQMLDFAISVHGSYVEPDEFKLLKNKNGFGLRYENSFRGEIKISVYNIQGQKTNQYTTNKTEQLQTEGYILSADCKGLFIISITEGKRIRKAFKISI